MTNEFTEGENKDFTKVTLNVPVNLLKEFKTISDLNHYSRVQAMLEAMRRFIRDHVPEDYQTPEQIKTTWTGVMDAIVEVSQDPKYQKLNPQEQQMVMKQQQLQEHHQKWMKEAIDTNANLVKQNKKKLAKK